MTRSFGWLWSQALLDPQEAQAAPRTRPAKADANGRRRGPLRLGSPYRLRVVEDGARRRVELKGDWLELHVPGGADRDARERRLNRWTREQLKAEIPGIVKSGFPSRGRGAAWAVKRMKTKWGTCNVDQKRIWLNLELAKKPPECLEYIVVHEMIHLLERNHTDRFYALQDRFMPDWRLRREVLNREPLAAEEWAVEAA